MVSFVFVLTLMSKLRGISTTPATSKMKFFVTLVNGFQPLTNITKNSMLDVAGFLETSLIITHIKLFIYQSLITGKAVTLIFCNEISCKADLYFKACFFHRLTCIFNYLICLVLLILLYSFCSKYIINVRNEFYSSLLLSLICNQIRLSTVELR